MLPELTSLGVGKNLQRGNYLSCLSLCLLARGRHNSTFSQVLIYFLLAVGLPKVFGCVFCDAGIHVFVVLTAFKDDHEAIVSGAVHIVLNLVSALSSGLIKEHHSEPLYINYTV